MKYLLVLSKTLFFYVVITIVYRIMGKREIGELSIMDLIVSILIAELAAMSIDRYEQNVFISLIPLIALVILQIIISRISLKKPNFRNFVEGEPSVIINRGKINFKEMAEQRYNIDDLLTELRGKGIKSIEEVDYAILETSGKLSIFQKDNKNAGSYPLPIILDGEIQDETLRQIRKSETWLNEKLEEEGVSTKDVFYAFYRNNQLFLIRDENVN